ncbi:response regulator [Reyranella sp. CPCC 100927]|uniref:response regulator n=1 Tax=Reyranella sp. CPCC 100927 TaxID=2599616 RepID=UPI001C49C324|nr:response regulator [Reyranella sp. CPCC 100927]
MPMPKQTTVLIVDDEVGLLDEMQVALTREGFSVLVASSAAAALEACTTRTDIAVALIDVGLPGMNGFDLIEALTNRFPAASRPRTVLVTGQGSVDMVIRAIRIGAFDFLEKPMARSELIAATHRAANSWIKGGL